MAWVAVLTFILIAIALRKAWKFGSCWAEMDSDFFATAKRSVLVTFVMGACGLIMGYLFHQIAPIGDVLWYSGSFMLGAVLAPITMMLSCLNTRRKMFKNEVLTATRERLSFRNPNSFANLNVSTVLIDSVWSPFWPGKGDEHVLDEKALMEALAVQIFGDDHTCFVINRAAFICLYGRHINWRDLKRSSVNPEGRLVFKGFVFRHNGASKPIALVVGEEIGDPYQPYGSEERQAAA